MFLIFTLLCGAVTQGLKSLLEAILPDDAEENGWGLEKIMATASGVLLLILASKFLYDWIQERREGNGEDQEDEAAKDSA